MKPHKKEKNAKKEIQDDKFWHLRTIEEVTDELSTSRKGLKKEDAESRILKFGKNVLSSEKSFQWYKVLFEKFNSILIYILFGASLIAFFSGETLEFVIILLIILMTVFLGFFQEYKADKTIKALNNLTAKKVLVYRDGQKKEISAEHLVVGDVVLLKRGDIVPADLRIIEVEGLQINESIITGESKERVKTTKHIVEENVGLGDMTNIAFSSTFVTGGSGIGIVVSTGLNTVIGKISASIQSIKNEKSPIAKKIDLMSKRISYIVIVVAILLFGILLFKGEGIYFSLLLVSAVAIAGIPESFPLALTLTFSAGIKRMAKQNAIVKDLNSVETLGTTTVICTDKTGTLTENKMRVAQIYFGDGNVYDVKGKGYEPINKFFCNEMEISKKDVISLRESFFKANVLCSDSELNFAENVWRVDGEPTEGALLALSKSVGFNEDVLRENYKRVFVLPFNPLKKYMISVHENIDDKSLYEFYLKGAGEIVLDMCSYYRGKDGKKEKLSPVVKNRIMKNIEEFNSKGLRVLSIASKDIKSKTKNDKDFAEKNLYGHYVFEGFCGIEDPIREEVFHAVEECHRSGIKIVMITGDHRLIAENIAEKLGLITHNSSKIMEGFEIDNMTDDELDGIISEAAVFARTSPEHKLRIVNSFQRKGEIVAMTGDGVNDAPALKKADIGISMGRNGTEVAREASNMVLTDDNFATIVKAVREGRTVYSNIRRFIYYLLTGNFTEVALIVICVIIGVPLPLTALMILFVNLVTSTIPALALSVEETHDKVMREKPRNPKDRLLSSYILTKILVLIPFLILGTLGVFLWELYIMDGSLEKAMTFAFVTLIMFELFHSFNSRSLHTTIFDKNFFNNKYLFVAVGASFVLTLLAVYSGVGQSIFSTVDLLLMDWIVIIFVSSLVIVFSEIIKLSVKAEFSEQSALQGIVIHLK